MADADYRRKLVEYFMKNLKKGYTEEALRWALIEQGYSRTEIMSAIERAHKELAQKAPILKTKPQIKYEIIDDHNKPVAIKKPWWKRVFG